MYLVANFLTVVIILAFFTYMIYSCCKFVIGVVSRLKLKKAEKL